MTGFTDHEVCSVQHTGHTVQGPLRSAWLPGRLNRDPITQVAVRSYPKNIFEGVRITDNIDQTFSGYLQMARGLICGDNPRRTIFLEFDVRQ